MNRENLEKYLFGLILFLLFCPMMQQKFSLLQIGALDGYDPTKNTVKDSVFSSGIWHNGVYQQAFEQYQSKTFGFRNWAIRLHNQWDYSMFNQSNASSVVIGKEHYLYGIDYVQAYNGEDFVGEERIKSNLDRYERVLDTLQKMGKKVIFTILPNKARLYAEYLPNRYVKDRTNVQTNYDVYTTEMDKRGLSYIDFDEWFRTIKNTAEYPLFPQTGIHLTQYGTKLFTDTLLNRIEQLTGKDIPELTWTNVATSTRAKGEDDDAEETLNLIFPMSYFPLPYADSISFNYKDTTKTRLKSLAIGDSFYWEFIKWDGMKQVFDEGQFWYYYRDAHPYGPRDVRGLNLAQELADKDVIIIINGAFNLWHFGFNFHTDFYQHFFRDEVINDPAFIEELIQEQMESAYKNQEWTNYMKQQAKELDQPFETVLYNNAAYIVKQRLGIQ